MATLVSTPTPPYYAVIFTSIHTPDADSGYGEMAGRMVELASGMPGFLGIESVRDASGVGITVSYWASEEAIRDWQRHTEHLEAQRLGRAKWYERFELRVCKVERAYGFAKSNPARQSG